MKFLHQMIVILLFSFLGEVLHSLIPAPIPASIYGMVLMFLALSLKFIKLEQVKQAGSFLVSFLPVLFVAPIVSLMDCWDMIKPNLAAILLIIVLSTVICFVVSGLTTQFLMENKKGGSKK